LLTNDGGVSRKLELPETGWQRRYRVRMFGKPTEENIAALAKGITVDGMKYGEIEAVIDSSKGRNTWMTVSLREGKNREIRKALDHLGYPVSRLIRIAYGPFQLGDLARGGVEEVPRRILKDQLGIKDSHAHRGRQA